MMREILFRGQTRRKGEKVYMGTGKPVDGNWVYGGITQGKGDFSVMYSYDPVEKHVVYTDTVGQFTGLTDKNGKKIFEGDIVKVRITQTEDKQTYGDCKYKIGVIVYNENFALFTCKNNFMNFINWAFNDYEVIGNIHDDPELLEVG